MPIARVTDKQSIAPLFSGWNETMIWSCLQDCMGTAYADNPASPRAAQIIIGDFCFFAGAPNEDLIRNHQDYSFDMVPQNESWAAAIERVYGAGVARQRRYATKKEGDVFCIPYLQGIVSALPAPYRLQAIDAGLYRQIMASDWAADLCGNFANSDHFLRHGLGFVITKGAEIVSGASTYTYYKEGIEIEIDTRPDERRRGLALAGGARLILECLRQGRYPSWDAHNLGSLALAQKLGYSFDKEYPTYAFVFPETPRA